MKVLTVFLLLLSVAQVCSELPECAEPEAEDLEILLETIAGTGPVC